MQRYTVPTAESHDFSISVTHALIDSPPIPDAAQLTMCLFPWLGSSWKLKLSFLLCATQQVFSCNNVVDYNLYQISEQFWKFEDAIQILRNKLCHFPDKPEITFGIVNMKLAGI